MAIDKNIVKKYIFSRPLNEICNIDTLMPIYEIYPLREYFETHTLNTILFDDDMWYEANEWTKIANEFIGLRLRQEKMKRLQITRVF